MLAVHGYNRPNTGSLGRRAGYYNIIPTIPAGNRFVSSVKDSNPATYGDAKAVDGIWTASLPTGL